MDPVTGINLCSMEALERLLVVFLAPSPDSKYLKEAEEHMEAFWIEGHPSELFIYLTTIGVNRTQGNTIGANNNAATFSSMAFILLRRYARKIHNKRFLFSTLPLHVQNEVKGLLLPFLFSSRPACDAAVELAAACSEPWYMLIDQLEAIFYQEDNQISISIYHALHLLCALSHQPLLYQQKSSDFNSPKNTFNEKGNSGLNKHQSASERLLQATITYLSSNDPLIVEEAVVTISTLLQALLDRKVIKKKDLLFKTILPLVWEAIVARIGFSSNRVLISLIELAEQVPRAFRFILPELILAMENGSIETECLFELIEFVVTITENAPKSILLLKEMTNFLNFLFKILISEQKPTITDEEWVLLIDSLSGADDQEDENELLSVAENALDRLAMAMGSNEEDNYPALAGNLFSLIATAIKSNSSSDIYVGLRVLSVVSEGLCRLLSPDQIALILLETFSKNRGKPKIEWALAHLIGQLATDLPSITRCASVLGLLQAILENGNGNEDILNQSYDASLTKQVIAYTCPKPRVMAHVAAALINWSSGINSDGSPDQSVSAFQTTIPRLCSLLLLMVADHRNPWVIRQALSTLCVLFDFYNDGGYPPVDSNNNSAMNPGFPSGQLLIKLQTILLPMLTDPNHPACDRAIELAAILGTESLVAALATLQTVAIRGNTTESGLLATNLKRVIPINTNSIATTTQSHLLPALGAAWACLAPRLGQRLEPILPLVLPQLIEGISGTNEDSFISMLDDEEERDGWEYLSIQGKRVGIHTQKLEEKADAINTLGALARGLGPLFGQERALMLIETLLAPLIGFSFHERLAMEAGNTCLALLSCCIVEVKKKVETWNNFFLPPIIKGLQKSFSSNVFEMEEEICQYLSLLTMSFENNILTHHEGAPFIIATLESFFGLLVPVINELISTTNNLGSGDTDSPDPNDWVDQSNECFGDAFIVEICALWHAGLKATQGALGLQKLAASGPFSSLINCFIALLDDHYRSSLIHEALGFWDDILLLCPVDPAIDFELIENCSRRILPRMAQIIQSTDSDCIQAAAYGLGLTAQNWASSSNYVHQFISTIVVPLLTTVLLAPLPLVASPGNDSTCTPTENGNITKRMNRMAWENCVSALCRVYNSGLIENENVLPIILASLPIYQDTEEFECVYGLTLINIISKNSNTNSYYPSPNHQYPYKEQLLRIALQSLTILKGKKTFSNLFDSLENCVKGYLFPLLTAEDFYSAWPSLAEPEREIARAMGVPL